MIDQLPEPIRNHLDWVFAHPLRKFPFLISLAVGAAVSVAVGFYLTYRVVVWYGT